MFKSGYLIKTAIPASLLLLTLLFMSGCLRVYVDPGPNPAALKVSIKAAVPKDEVDSIKKHSFRSVTGPYWEWWVYKIDGKGVYQDLKPKGKGPERWKGAFSLDEGAVFLVQPGSYKVRLRVTAYLDYEIRGGDRAGITIKSVPIADWEEDIMLQAGPGGSQSFTKDFGVKIKHPEQYYF